MADFEDSMSPTWDNVIEGADQPARRGRPHHRVHVNPDGKTYRLHDKVSRAVRAPARLAPGGEALTVDGKPVSASLFDFGLYFFHNAKALLRNAAAAPYFYLPKMESHLEATAMERRVHPCAGQR